MKANNFYLNILAAGMLAITTGCAGAHDTENSNETGTATETFYLPALGNLNVGFFLSIGVNGYAWSSSAYPDPHVNNLSYYLDFTPSKVFVAANTRINGFPVSAFE